MRSRLLGTTGLEVSELSLGTWGLSGDAYGSVTDAEQDKVIDRAKALGITLFDTADTYAHGGMQKRLGERLPADSGTHIVTKIGTDRDADPARKCFKPQFLRDAFHRCQDQIGRDPLDIVLLHNPSLSAVESGEATDVLQEFVSAGKLRAWGVSLGSAETGKAAVAKGAQVLELAYNVLHSTELRELTEVITEKKVGVLARSVLSYGLLCGHWPPHKTFPGVDHRSQRWTADELRRRVSQLDAVRSLVGGPVLTMRAGALRFVLANDLISSAVLGPKNIIQLDQLVREAGREPPYLSDEKLTKLATRLRDVGADQ